MADTTTDLIGQWLLNGDLSAEVGDAQTALAGTVTYATPAGIGFEQVGVFDGSSASATAAAFPSLDETSAQTISVWVQTLDNQGYVVSTRDGAVGGLSLYIDNPGFVRAVIGTSTFGTTNPTDMHDGDWHHIAVTYDGNGSGASTLTLYIDGKAEGTDTNSAFTWTDTEEAFLGCRGDGVGGGTLFLDGNMADARIYERELAAADVHALYLAGKPPVLNLKVTLSATAVDELISDGVVNFGTHSLSTADNTKLFSVAAASGADVWLSSDEAGTSPIDADIYYWDDSGSEFACNVGVGSTSAVTDTVFYVKVGSKPSSYTTDPYPATAEGVYPLDSDFDDRTANSHDGTGVGSPTAGDAATGPNGVTPATNFDGVTQSVYSSISGAVPATMSCWIKSDAAVSAECAMGWANFATSSNYSAVYAMGNVGGDPVYAYSRNTDINSASTSTGFSTATWHHIAGSMDASGNLTAYIDGGSVGTQTGADSPSSLDNFEIGALGRSSTHISTGAFGGDIALVRLDSAIRSAAEINLDYLLQGSTASTYFTVDDVTSLPAASFDLRSDREVVLSGSNVTSWGNASGGTSPTYSDAVADRALGFPAIQCDGATTYLEWPDIASMFSGDDPDFTLAMVFRPNYGTGTDVMLSTGNTSNGRFLSYCASGANVNYARRDDASTTGSIGSVAYSDDEPNLMIVKSEGGIGSIFVRNISTGVETSIASDISGPVATTLTLGAIGCYLKSTGTNSFYRGDLFRIRLYNSALGGDLTGDLTGTQLGELKRQMLQQSSNNTFRGPGRAIRSAIRSAF